jgi:moderate conductance mechanosensitive channel
MRQSQATVAALGVVGFIWIALAVVAAGGTGEIRPSAAAGGMIAKVAIQTSELEKAVHGVINGFPSVKDQVVSSVSKIFTVLPESRQPATQLTLLAATLSALGLFVVLMLKLPLNQPVPSVNGVENPVFRLLLRDALTVATLFAAGFVTVRLLFAHDTPLDHLSVAVVWGFVRWWTVVRIVSVVLRPDHPEARLFPASDQAARNAQRFAAIAFGIGISFISVVPVLLGGGLQAPAARALALIIGIAEGAIALVAIRILFSREQEAHYGLGLALRGTVVAVVVIWIASVLALEFSTYHSVVLCLEAVGGAYILDRLLSVGAHGRVNHYALATRRVVWLATALAVLFGLAKLILVQLFHVITPAAWLRAQPGYTSAFLITSIGFALYEGIKAWASMQFADALAVPAPGDEQTGRSTSRLATVMPIAVGFGGALILAVALILALSELGISVGPLIAGASIVGLAFSFGAQALVRDVISGVFYMIDDAFRVGEYVDTGRHKGTVEKISLRSVRLRHQNGQFHNVPYGQFGAVTNFSRDWITLKFNLRVNRSVDVERVRKLTKQLGQDLLEDPEFGTEFLLPLKLQGLVDVQENALVLRFKFTVKPTEPTLVRRGVLKRLYQLFNENNIIFADNAVIVHSPTQLDAAGAGAAGAASRIAGGNPKLALEQTNPA